MLRWVRVDGCTLMCTFMRVNSPCLWMRRWLHVEVYTLVHVYFVCCGDVMRCWEYVDVYTLMYVYVCYLTLFGSGCLSTCLMAQVPAAVGRDQTRASNVTWTFESRPSAAAPKT